MRTSDDRRAPRDEQWVMSTQRSRPSRIVRRSSLLAVAAMLCTACTGSLFESDIPAATRYVLAAVPPAANPSSSAASQVDLAISRPDVAPGLDTEGVAVLRGRQLDYYRAAKWGGSVTEVVQALLINSFQDQQLFRSVVAEQTRVSGDYIFDVEVRDFQAEYGAGDAPPVAHVTIIGRLIRLVDREMIGTVSATASKAATENRMGPVAAAFESAVQQVALELAGKTAAATASDIEHAGK
jgi:cholesterol transport system auxiliary component